LAARDFAPVTENGLKALEALEQTAADIAIVDWQMDVMDGMEFIRRVRAGYGSVNPKTPILMLTGVVGEEGERQAYDLGVNLFMNKPFSMKSLFQGIQKLI
jgi:CheY-like chemotaxis protein